MHSRALILRQAGFLVDEAFNLRNAIALAASDSIDALIICHTLSKQEQRQLISSARKLRTLLPIICIAADNYDPPSQGCINTHNRPAELLGAVASAVYIPPTAAQRALSGWQ
jgi:hypothetical protein